jgi:hypothetical protein
VINELESVWKSPNLMYNISICLEGLRKTMRSLNQGQDLNLGPQVYECLTSAFSRTRSFTTRYSPVHRLAKALQVQKKKKKKKKKKKLIYLL